MMSTPRGREGFFYDTWSAGKTRRIFARSVDIPRLTDKVEYDRRFMSEMRFRANTLRVPRLRSAAHLSRFLDKAISTENALCLN